MILYYERLNHANILKGRRLPSPPKERGFPGGGYVKASPSDAAQAILEPGQKGWKPGSQGQVLVFPLAEF